MVISDRIVSSVTRRYPFYLLGEDELFDPNWASSHGVALLDYARRPVVRVCANNMGPRVTYHETCHANGRKAVLERVFFVEDGKGGFRRPPEPRLGIQYGMDIVLPVYRRYVKLTTPVPAMQVAEMYKGRRRTKYLEAARAFDARDPRANLATISAFIKVEKVLKVGAIPRVIQARNPVFNIALGRYLKPIETDIYKGFNAVGREMLGDDYPIILKGFNASESGSIVAGKWGRFENPVAVPCDASRFDQHVHKRTLAKEHQFYTIHYAGEDRRQLERILRKQLKNVCFLRNLDGVIKYIVDGRRMSGDMNTGLGNSVIMASELIGFLVTVGVKASIGVNGDDSFIILEQSDLAKLKGLSKWFLDRGFTLKIEEPVYNLEELEFCQTHPIWTPQGYIMVRNFPTALAKDHTCTSRRDLKKWLYAVGQCGLALTGGVPIYQEVYNMMMRSGEPSRISYSPAFESGFARLAVGMDRRYTPVDDMTRVSFWQAFGVLPDEQIALEQSVMQYVYNDCAADCCPLVGGQICKLVGEG